MRLQIPDDTCLQMFSLLASACAPADDDDDDDIEFRAGTSFRVAHLYVCSRLLCRRFCTRLTPEKSWGSLAEVTVSRCDGDGGAGGYCNLMRAREAMLSTKRWKVCGDPYKLPHV